MTIAKAMSIGAACLSISLLCDRPGLLTLTNRLHVLQDLDRHPQHPLSPGSSRGSTLSRTRVQPASQFRPESVFDLLSAGKPSIRLLLCHAASPHTSCMQHAVIIAGQAGMNHYMHQAGWMFEAPGASMCTALRYCKNSCHQRFGKCRSLARCVNHYMWHRPCVQLYAQQHGALYETAFLLWHKVTKITSKLCQLLACSRCRHCMASLPLPILTCQAIMQGHLAGGHRNHLLPPWHGQRQW
jgi:hypothetical protein